MSVIAKPYKTPISVLVLIYTRDLQVLLLERADKASFWQSVTGSVEAGDVDLRATAVRELAEETGLAAGEHVLTDWGVANTYEIFAHWRYRYAPGVTHNVEHVFGLELAQAVPVTLAPAEHVRYEWVDWREAAERVFSWTNVDAIKRLGARHHLVL